MIQLGYHIMVAIGNIIIDLFTCCKLDTFDTMPILAHLISQLTCLLCHSLII